MNLAHGNELELYEFELIMHLESMVRGLRKLKPEHWDWTPHQAAPTPRTVAVHAWQWLQCDRQHILEPDLAKHSLVLEPPEDSEAFCAAFQEETDNWRNLLSSLTLEDLDQPRFQFGNPEYPMNVRFFIGHMVQNVIYKHGQFAEVYFALGYDGSEPYSAPFPNPVYRELLGIEGSVEEAAGR